MATSRYSLTIIRCKVCGRLTTRPVSNYFGLTEDKEQICPDCYQWVYQTSITIEFIKTLDNYDLSKLTDYGTKPLNPLFYSTVKLNMSAPPYIMPTI